MKLSILLSKISYAVSTSDDDITNAINKSLAMEKILDMSFPKPIANNYCPYCRTGGVTNGKQNHSEYCHYVAYRKIIKD